MGVLYLFLVLVIQGVMSQEEMDSSTLPTSSPTTIPELTTGLETNETSSNVSSTEESLATSEVEALVKDSEMENTNSTAVQSVSTEDTIVESIPYVTEDESQQNQTLPPAKPTADFGNGASPLAQSGLFIFLPMCFQLLRSRFLCRL
ncbi:uncharacterized protein LOC118194944 isoform X2 [Stegodyphus dumicola]|nr:uncharacterized protein LOC118194944 isoform X2 [Stegodyphus dumicola]XP_035222055.1 uncharacterized protein LOC118194944 isoform X2 [Stegodyphus dumicola]